MSAKGKCSYPNLRWRPETETTAKKYFAVFTHLIHKACHILSTLYQSVSLPPSSSPSLLIFATSSLPIKNISTSVSSSELDIQHFLKPFTITFGEMHCHVIVIHTDYIIHLYFLVDTLTCSHKEDSQFFPQMVSVVLRIFNMYVADFWVVSVVWSVWIHVFLNGFVDWSRFYFWVL